MKKGIEIGRNHNVEPIKKMVGPLAPNNIRVGGDGVAVKTVAMVAFLSLIIGALGLLGIYGHDLAALVETLRHYTSVNSLALDPVSVLKSFGKKPRQLL